VVGVIPVWLGGAEIHRFVGALQAPSRFFPHFVSPPGGLDVRVAYPCPNQGATLVTISLGAGLRWSILMLAWAVERFAARSCRIAARFCPIVEQSGGSKPILDVLGQKAENPIWIAKRSIWIDCDPGESFCDSGNRRTIHMD
jgi:hypothetical protein